MYKPTSTGFAIRSPIQLTIHCRFFLLGFRVQHFFILQITNNNNIYFIYYFVGSKTTSSKYRTSDDFLDNTPGTVSETKKRLCPGKSSTCKIQFLLYFQVILVILTLGSSLSIKKRKRVVLETKQI